MAPGCGQLGDILLSLFCLFCSLSTFITKKRNLLIMLQFLRELEFLGIHLTYAGKWIKPDTPPDENIDCTELQSQTGVKKGVKRT